MFPVYILFKNVDNPLIIEFSTQDEKQYFVDTITTAISNKYSDTYKIVVSGVVRGIVLLTEVRAVY